MKTDQNHKQKQQEPGTRVRAAEFARMVGVSRSAVSGWIKRGLMDGPGDDGKIDHVRAARQVMKNADPEKLRAPMLRRAAETLNDVHERADRLQSEVERLKAAIGASGSGVSADVIGWDALSFRLVRLQVEFLRRGQEIAEAQKAGRLYLLIDRIIGENVYQFEPGEIQEMQKDLIKERKTDAEHLRYLLDLLDRKSRA